MLCSGNQLFKSIYKTFNVGTYMVNVTFWFSPSFEEEQDNRVFHESTWTQNKWAWWEIATSLNSLNTRKMQTTRYKSMAFSLEEMGACSLDVNSQFRNVDWLLLETNLTLLKMLMRTRKSVTRSPILANISKFKKKERERERERERDTYRPGTTSGLMRKLTQEVTTNINEGR